MKTRGGSRSITHCILHLRTIPTTVASFAPQSF